MSNMPEHPGIPAFMDAPQAVVRCEQTACDAAVVAGPDTRDTMGGCWSAAVAAGIRNLEGRTLREVRVENPAEAVPALAGLAQSGLRATGFLCPSDLPRTLDGLRGMAAAHLPLVLHVDVAQYSAGESAGFAALETVALAAESGVVVLAARDAQAAADLTLIARRIAEQALAPVMLVADGWPGWRNLEPLRLPEPALIAQYLGRPQDPVDCPTPAQRLLFGEQRRRVPEGWSVDQPAARGMPMDGGTLARALAARREYFAGHLNAIADAAMADYARLTGRDYQRVRVHGHPKADTLIVASGAAAAAAGAVAGHLRRSRRLKVGVVEPVLLRPFPGDLVGERLFRHGGVLVLEAQNGALGEDPPLLREVRAEVNRCLENGRAARNTLPHPGHAAYGRAEQAPLLYSALFGPGEQPLDSAALAGAVENALPGGAHRPRLYLSVDFLRAQPRSPKEEIFLQTLEDGYPHIRHLSALRAGDSDVQPQDAFTVCLLQARGREVWDARANLGRTLAGIPALAGRLAVRAFAHPIAASREASASFQVVCSSGEAPEPVPPPLAQVLLAAEPGRLRQPGVLAGLRDGGALVLPGDPAHPGEVWNGLPGTVRQELLERGLRVYLLDSSALTAQSPGDPDSRAGALGMALQGAALALPDLVAQTRLAPKPLLRGFKEWLVAWSEEEPALDTEALAEWFQAGLEGLIPLEPGSPHEAAESRHEAPALPAVIKDLPRHPVPALDLNRAWEEVAATDARGGVNNAALAEPFVASDMVPAASAAVRDVSAGREEVPLWNPGACTGCGACWMVCPDSALSGLVNTVDEVLNTLVRQVEQERGSVRHLPRAVRTLNGKWNALLAAAPLDADVPGLLEAAVREVPDTLRLGDEARAEAEAELEALLAACGGFPLALTEHFFTGPEGTAKGSGGLLSVTLHPSKCKGCQACVRACPEEGALEPRPQTPGLLAPLRRHGELWRRLPSSDTRFITTESTPDGAGPATLLLDKRAQVSLSGGDGGLPGAAEKTALRLFAAAAVGALRPRVAAHLEQVRDLIGRLEQHIQLNLAVDTGDPQALQSAVASLGQRDFTLSELSAQMNREGEPVNVEWLQRVTGLLAGLQRLEQAYAGDHGGARASLAMVQDAASAAAWGLRYPFNPFPFPWAGQPGEGAGALALGLFEGHMARMAEGFKAVRMAELELEERYNPEIHDPFFAAFSWRDFSEEEVLLCPPVALAAGTPLCGGGWDALSALLRSGRPVRVLVLDDGIFRGLAGAVPALQAAPLPVQKEAGAPLRGSLALDTLAWGGAFTAQCSLADLDHLMASLLAGLSSARPALFSVFASRLPAHGGGDDLAVAQSRLALESRAHPLFRFDPDGGAALHEQLSLAGNPSPEQPWPTRALGHLDGDGEAASTDLPVTLADFAAGVPGLEGHFRAAPDQPAEGEYTLLDEYLALEPDEREEAVPFIWLLDAEGRLARRLVSPALVWACGDCQRVWSLLRQMTREDIVPVDEQAIAGQAQAQLVDTVVGNLMELARGGGDLSETLLRMAGPEADPEGEGAEPNA